MILLRRKLRGLGPVAHLYKVDISRGFRHLKIDPPDYDLLGLEWNGAYIDTCLAFGSRHSSQHFQGVNDALHFMLSWFPFHKLYRQFHWFRHA